MMSNETNPSGGPYARHPNRPSCTRWLPAGLLRRGTLPLAGACTTTLLMAGILNNRGAGLPVPNGSFETPETTYVDNQFGSWQKTPKPFWYDEGTSFPWDLLTGIFLNTAPGSADHIDNCHGDQAAYLFAVPQVGLFQDYNSLEGTNTTPSLAFDAKFEVGKSYQLTVAAVGGGGGMSNGVTLQLSLYYRDAASNQVTVAATTITNSSAVFSNATHLLDFAVIVPPVKPGDAWAGQHIGVQILSTVDPGLAGGYWDVDHVRLAELITIPNGSFENPPTSYADSQFGSWQKTPKPFWYDEGTMFPWDLLTGVFLNTAPGSADHIHNCEGAQAAFLFAVPQVGLFQDFSSLEGTNTTPSHDFNARFEAGKSYRLTVGLIGGGGSMASGVTLQLSLYYRDAASNQVTVASTRVTNTPALFPDTTNFVDFTVQMPAVKPGDAWAGQHIGVQLLSTVDGALAGGYWDVDHVRLASRWEPVLLAPRLEGGRLTFNLRSEPDLDFDLLAAAQPDAAPGAWILAGSLTNVSGNTPVSEPAGAGNRFHRVRQR